MSTRATGVDEVADGVFLARGADVNWVLLRDGRDVTLIDTGYPGYLDEVLRSLTRIGSEPEDVAAVLITHAHVDHITGVATAKSALDVPVYLHRDDLFLYENVVQQGALFGFKVQPQPPVDVFYDLSPIYFGDYEVRVHHTPGHCPGGVCLQIGRKGDPARDLFVGDTLFAGSIGRTDLPGGDYAVLMRSITDVLFALGDTSIVHPGHGPDTTIQRERTTNPFVLEYLRS